MTELRIKEIQAAVLPETTVAGGPKEQEAYNQKREGQQNAANDQITAVRDQGAKQKQTIDLSGIKEAATFAEQTEQQIKQVFTQMSPKQFTSAIDKWIQGTSRFGLAFRNMGRDILAELDCQHARKAGDDVDSQSCLDDRHQGQF